MKKKATRRRRVTQNMATDIARSLDNDKPLQAPDFGVWHAMVQEFVVHKRPHGRVRIGVVNSGLGGTWNALGIETVQAAMFGGADVQAAMTDKFFADHAHANLGVFPTLDEAKVACERFCRSRASVAACACEAVA